MERDNLLSLALANTYQHILSFMKRTRSFNQKTLKDTFFKIFGLTIKKAIHSHPIVSNL